MSQGDFYGGYDSSRGSNSSRSGAMILLDTLFVCVSLVVLSLFVILLLSSHLSPDTLGALSAIGLYSLYIYMAMLALTLYWLMRWRWVNTVVMGVTLIIGLFSLSDFYKLEIRRQHPAKYPRSYKLLSFNMDQTDIASNPRGYDSLKSFIYRLMPNIVTLQEVYSYDSIDSILLSTKFKQMPYTSKRRDTTMAIYSRYTFVNKHSVDSLPNIIWSDIISGNDTIRIFNISLHMDDVPRDSISGKKLYRSQNISQRMKMWNRASSVRVKQLEKILPYLKMSPYPYVVAGSVNDIPFSYAYNRISENRQDAYVEKGYGFSYTYRGFDEKLRLDYAFFSNALEVLSYEVVEHAKIAVHLPIFVRFDHVQQNNINK